MRRFSSEVARLKNGLLLEKSCRNIQGPTGGLKIDHANSGDQIYTEIDTSPGNLHTFEAVLKFSQLLSWSFWSNSTEYLNVSSVGFLVFVS